MPRNIPYRILTGMTDEELFRQFEDLSLPFDRWTHRTHVRVACLYARKYPYAEALKKLRTGIQRYNRRNDVPETLTTGYNETTTVAFFRLVSSALQNYESIYPTGNSDDFCDVHPHLLSKTLLRIFYSPARRSRPEAKSEFVEPDLCTLPPEPDRL